MDKKFPLYDRHGDSVDASCFNCGDMFDKAIGQPSGRRERGMDEPPGALS